MDQIKKYIKTKLDGDQGYRMLHLMSRNWLISKSIGLMFGSNLTKLAILNNTDKFKRGVHNYTVHYQRHFHSLRKKRLNLLEIGVGGYFRPDRGGGSLRMWKRYFSKARIYGLDIYDKKPQEEHRIKIFKGSQVDLDFLNKTLESIDGGLDIIIDDGSHINEHVVTTFKYLFPKLNKGGYYVVEDTETSYREDYGGDSRNLENPQTMLNFFKTMVDAVNYENLSKESSKLKTFPFNQSIEAVHVYRSLIFIKKKS